MSGTVPVLSGMVPKVLVMFQTIQIFVRNGANIFDHIPDNGNVCPECCQKSWSHSRPSLVLFWTDLSLFGTKLAPFRFRTKPALLRTTLALFRTKLALLRKKLALFKTNFFVPSHIPDKYLIVWNMTKNLGTIPDKYLHCLECDQNFCHYSVQTFPFSGI